MRRRIAAARTPAGPIRLVGSRDAPLSLAEVSAAVGDVAVIAAVSRPHRADAFAACERLVEDLKHEVPIRRHQLFADGEAERVGAC